MLAILKREVKNYFKSPVGYVFLGIYLAISGLLFFLNVIRIGVVDFSNFFNAMFLTIIFSMPILTMGLLSDEYRFKTDRLLFSSPVGIFSIVIGKYLAACILYFIASLVNILYVLVISFFVNLQFGLIISCLIGTILIGFSLISIGVFVSCLTGNSVISAFGAFGIFILFIFIGEFSSYIPFKWMKDFVNGLVITTRYNNFVMGIVNISDILYFVSIVVIFSFLSIAMLLKKRWN